jgi:hypothetical protein
MRFQCSQDNRHEFEAAKFAQLNNLTVVDIIWFKTKTNAAAADASNTATPLSLAASSVSWWKIPTASSNQKSTAVERKSGVGECSEKFRTQAELATPIGGSNSVTNNANNAKVFK